MSETEFITCRGQLHALLPGTYWHLTQPNGMMLHNVWLAEGICPSISTINRMPGLEKAASPYAIKAMSDAKEQIREATRLEVYAGLPSRKGAVFLFESGEQATSAMRNWFPKETRRLIEARIVEGAAIHVADARLLDCRESEWDANARKYWRGQMTASPFREVLVDGLVYFPGWRAKPFGLMHPHASPLG